MTAPLACLIPAHNEAARIGAVLRAVTGQPDVAQVLVIDDGSRDGTAEVVRAHGAEVLCLSPNRGKTAALAAGIAAVQAQNLMLLDADLLGLGAQDISRLIAPVTGGRADVTLSLRGNAPWLWQRLGVDYISGERVLPRALVAPHLARMETLPRFGFEVFLNRLILDAGLRAEVVPWPGVASPSKAAKRGVWRGPLADAAMLADMMRAVPPLELARQIAALCPHRGRFLPAEHLG